MTAITATKERTAGTWRGRDAVGWISLAASPTFALMAWTAATDTPRIALCASGSDMLSIDGMAWMYLLMSLFHVSPWLKLAFDRPQRLVHPQHKTEGD
jgi:hypothetical protein